MEVDASRVPQPLGMDPRAFLRDYW